MQIAIVRSLAAGLVLTLAAAVAGAAEKSLSVTEKVAIAATPANAWAAIKDFNGWQTWHPAIASTKIIKGSGNRKGTVRVLTTKDGANITEELLAHSASSMKVTYRIIDSPLPVTNYVSTLKVNKTKTGCTVVWSSTFKAKAGTSDDEAKKVIAGIYRAGLDNLPSVVK
jgi:Polyketide cyclase / dehydrase and lipid transport